jgi:hypothetical protein
MLVERIKADIDLHELAARLGIQRGKTGNYHAPWRDDKKPSVSIYPKNGRAAHWKDHGSGKGGSAIDLVMETLGIGFTEALDEISKMYGFERDRPKPNRQKEPDSRERYLWRIAKDHKGLEKASDYLSEERKIPKTDIDQLKGTAYGYSDYTPKENAEQHGPAVVFPVQNIDGEIIALNLRYLAPDHEPKSRIIGSSHKGFFTPSWHKTRGARSVWLVESAIDALTLQAAGCPAIAYLSSSHVHGLPLDWVDETQNLILWPDCDAAGQLAASTLYHRALSRGITVQVVDLEKFEYKDPNDALRGGTTIEDLHQQARRFDTRLFPTTAPWLPESEYGAMRAYQCHRDHTEMTILEERDGDKRERLVPVAGFRVYRIDPITVYDPVTAVGGVGSGHTVNKSLVVSRRADSPFMQRTVLGAEEMGKPDTWRAFGWVHAPAPLCRMLQTLSRDQSHKQETVNVIGLVRVGKALQINDAANTYLRDEDCVYHRLRIPDGPRREAARTLEKLSSMLTGEKALLTFVWAIGSMMKVFSGFWPHLVVSANSGSGKTTLIEAMHKLLGVLSIEPSELSTPYRRMRVVGNHVYPVFCDEFSRASPKDVGAFIDTLNVSYKHALRHHGREGMFLLAAPVALIGQDAPTHDAAILTKLIQFDLDHSKGQLAHFEEAFPVREFATWLSERLSRITTRERIQATRSRLVEQLRGQLNEQEANLNRFLDNYAAVLIAFEELCAFSSYANAGFEPAVVEHIQRQLSETAMTRRESLAILDRLTREMAVEPAKAPLHRIEGDAVIIPPNLILDFLAARGYTFPVTSTRRLIAHLNMDGFLVERSLSRTIQGQHFSKCVKLNLRKMLDAGIDWPIDDNRYAA